MTTPREEQPQTEVAATPSVTTAPPRARWRFGNVPSRLGRARTSTVVLAVLFVAVFVLWVYVRPPTVTTPASSTSGVTGPADPGTTAPAPTTSEAPTTAPTTTAPRETTTESSTPTDQTTTGGTTTTSAASPTTSRAPTSVGVPTTVPAPTS